MKNAVNIWEELGFRIFCNLVSVKAQFWGVFKAKYSELPYYSSDLFKAGEAVENSEHLCSLLKGAQECYRDTVLFNVAIALHVAGSENILMNGEIYTSTLKEKIAIAAYSLESGLAYKALMRIREALSLSCAIALSITFVY